MSLLPVAPRPVDEDDVSVLRSHAIATAAPARAVRKTTTASCDPAEARLRGGRYLYCAVSVVGFPEGVSGDALTAFLRRFGPVPGPGGVRQVMHAWGLEVLLIFPTQEAATHAIDDIGKLVSLELGDRVVTLTSALSARVTRVPTRKDVAIEPPRTEVQVPLYGQTVPMLVPIMPYATPFYAHHHATFMPEATPLVIPTSYFIVPTGVPPA